MAKQRQPRTKEELVRDFRTAEILDATRRVIAELGAADVSMERIASEAGVSKGTIYLYFKNKEELLVRAVADGFAELMERTAEAIAHEPRPTKALVAIARVGLEHSSRHQEFFEALQRSRFGPEGASLLAAEVQTQIARYVALIAEALGRGVRSGQFRELDVQSAAHIFVATLRGVFFQHVRRGETAEFERDASTLVDFFVHGIAANGGSA